MIVGVVDLPAATVAERARMLQRDADGLRRLLTLTRFFDAFFMQVIPNLELAHPQHGAMPPLSLGLLAGPLQADAGGTRRVDVAVYTDGGVICAGPTGTGTTPSSCGCTSKDSSPPA